MKGTLMIEVILTVAVTYAVGLRCYVGTQVAKVEQECGGSCFTATFTDPSITDVGLNCVQSQMNATCVTGDQSKTCYCNTDLCNSVTSGVRPLNATWMLAISGILAKLCLHKVEASLF